MLAAPGPPTQKVAWVAALEEGPDERLIREQLVGHAKVMSVFYLEAVVKKRGGARAGWTAGFLTRLGVAA